MRFVWHFAHSYTVELFEQLSIVVISYICFGWWLYAEGLLLHLVIESSKNRMDDVSRLFMHSIYVDVSPHGQMSCPIFGRRMGPLKRTKCLYININLFVTLDLQEC